MQTAHSRFFAGQTQGTPAVAGGRRGPATAVAALLSLSLLGPVLPAATVSLALADGGSGPDASYGPPPPLPPGSVEDDADTPRRDIRMGTVDHMQMGRDDDGNVVMEIRPRPKKVEDQPQVGPFYIYPQIGGQPMPMGGQPGQAGPPGQPGRPGRPGQPPHPQPLAPGQGQAGQPGQGNVPGQAGAGRPSPQGQWSGQGPAGQPGQPVQGFPVSGQGPHGQQGAGF